MEINLTVAISLEFASEYANIGYSGSKIDRYFKSQNPNYEKAAITHLSRLYEGHRSLECDIGNKKLM